MGNTMSFSREIKSELCKLENKQLCCLRAECYGIWLFSKCFSLREAVYVTENGSVARRMLELAAAAAGAGGELTYGVSRRRNPAYRVSLPDEGSRRALLSAFGHTGREVSLLVNRAVLEHDCCQSAFLRGAFLACGTATDPNKEYHLEFAVSYQNLGASLCRLLEETEACSLTPSLTRRKGSYIVYLKDSEQIENLLTYLGAPAASMELMQVKMYKEAKNDINRRSNFETANMDKTYSASARQTAAIALINDTVGLGSLPKELEELARLRLENSEMTLRQLGEALGISRSGVNHRMQKLLQLGEKLSKEKGMETFMEG